MSAKDYIYLLSVQKGHRNRHISPCFRYKKKASGRLPSLRKQLVIKATQLHTTRAFIVCSGCPDNGLALYRARALFK